MRGVAEAHPDDLDAWTLYAEAKMNLVPWNYWAEDGSPRPETEALVTALERVMAQEPAHPRATHLYIHAMENSPTPEAAEATADNLRDLDIQIGHMIVSATAWPYAARLDGRAWCQGMRSSMRDLGWPSRMARRVSAR